MLILPELNILVFSILFLFISISGRKDCSITCAKIFSLIVFFVSLLSLNQVGELFSGAYRIDLYSQVFKIVILLGFCLVIFMFENKGETMEDYLPEFFMFLGFSVLGLMMIVSSIELISIVIALEISSYSLYVILPLRKSQKRMQIEASMKYLFFGAASTGIMLFGMGYLYGIAHSTFLKDIVQIIPGFLSTPIGIIALVFTLTGFFFKLSLFPMHFWSPDVYEGASNTTTTFIGTIPKIAGTALLIRIVMLAYPGSTEFINILIVLAALSMTFGNLVGLVQKDVKRLLAYSGIAHAGYLLMGVLSMSRDGNASAIYYITIYLFMNLACFYVVILLSREGENVSTENLAGLSKRSPLLALVLAVSAFSLAGIPPTGGFTGKLFLFTSAFKAGHLPIVLIGAVNTVISIFFYLNLVRMSYSKDIAATIEPIKLSFYKKVICCIFIFVILYMGIQPFGLFELFKASV